MGKTLANWYAPAVIKGSFRFVGNPKSILLIQLGDIGDVVLTFPCLRALRESFPKANIQVAVRDKAAGLIQGCRWADGVISVSKKKGCGVIGSIRQQIQFIIGLRKNRFDVAIDMRTGTRGAIMAFLSGASERISFLAYDEPFWRNWLFTTLIDHSYQPGQYVADYLLDLLARFGIVPGNSVPEYTIAAESDREATAILNNEGVNDRQPLLAIQPFSLWNYKELPEETMAALINKIQENNQVDIILIGSPAERDKAEHLEEKLKKKIHNLVGKTTIAVLPALLNKCSFFIGIDSAGLHIAAAVGTRTAAIFGPSAPESWAPRGDEHIVIQAGFTCIPCRQKGCNNSETSRCLQSLDHEMIYQTIKPIIAGSHDN
jgi:heptosyltransferase-3